MAKWQRFGDGTWVNVDQVEVVRVEEQDDGGWQLVATFSSGSTFPLGSHVDRGLLVDCTDVLLRDEVGEHLRAATHPAGSTTPTMGDAQPVAVKGRGWRFWRPEAQLPKQKLPGVGLPEQVGS